MNSDDPKWQEFIKSQQADYENTAALFLKALESRHHD